MGQEHMKWLLPGGGSCSSAASQRDMTLPCGAGDVDALNQDARLRDGAVSTLVLGKLAKCAHIVYRLLCIAVQSSCAEQLCSTLTPKRHAAESQTMQHPNVQCSQTSSTPALVLQRSSAHAWSARQPNSSSTWRSSLWCAAAVVPSCVRVIISRRGLLSSSTITAA
jgi:hypothetical protein